MTREDFLDRDYRDAEQAAREAAELGPLCADCGEHTGPEPHVVRPGEEYCDRCAAALCALVAEQADPLECGGCNGDGEVSCGLSRCTCPVCRGSGLSGAGERALRGETRWGASS